MNSLDTEELDIKKLCRIIGWSYSQSYVYEKHGDQLNVGHKMDELKQYIETWHQASLARSIREAREQVVEQFWISVAGHEKYKAIQEALKAEEDQS